MISLSLTTTTTTTDERDRDGYGEDGTRSKAVQGKDDKGHSILLKFQLQYSHCAVLSAPA